MSVAKTVEPAAAKVASLPRPGYPEGSNLGRLQNYSMGVCHYARYVNVITASGYESGMHRGTYQVITLSVKLGEGDLSVEYNISFQSTKSGAGEQFLILDCRARSFAKGVFVSQTVATTSY